MQLQCLIFGILFLAGGIFFFSGAAIPRMKEWKVLTEEEKKKIRVGALGKNVGIVLGTAGVLFVLAAWSRPFREQAFLWSIILWLILTGVDVYDMEKSKRYHNSKEEKRTGGAA